MGQDNQNKDPSLTPKLLSETQFSAIKDAMTSLLSWRSIPLFGDETAGDAQVTGLQRTLKVPGLDTHPGTVNVAVYTENMRSHMAALLQLTGVGVEHPIGHIKLGKEHKGVSLDGELYLEQSGRIVGKVDCRIGNPEDNLADSNDVCQTFANQVGLGQEWQWFWAEGSRQESIPTEYDDVKATDLIELLQAFQNRGNT